MTILWDVMVFFTKAAWVSAVAAAVVDGQQREAAITVIAKIDDTLVLAAAIEDWRIRLPTTAYSKAIMQRAFLFHFRKLTLTPVVSLERKDKSGDAEEQDLQIRVCGSGYGNRNQNSIS